MVILAPENGTRTFLPPGPILSDTGAAIAAANEVLLAKQAAALREKAAEAARAAARAAAGRVTILPTITTAGGAGTNTTPLRPVAVPIAKVPPPIAKVTKLPPLAPLRAAPLPPTIGLAVGGGGAAGGAGILLLVGLALLASFGKRK